MSLARATSNGPRLVLPLWVPAALIAVAVAVAIGDPSPERLTILAVLLGAGVLAAAALAPLAGYLVLVASCVMSVVVSVGSGERNVMPFDVLLIPLIFACLPAWLRRTPVSIVRTDERRTAMDEATRRFTRSAWMYAVIAAGSLLVTVAMGNPSGAFDSGLKLGRAVQGMLMFGIGMVCIRDERSLRRVVSALVAGGLLLSLVNLAGFVFAPITSDNTLRRAGMTWFMNERGWSTADPNEAAIGLLLLWVVLLARQSHRARPWGWIMMALTLVFMMLTQSRSGLLAWIVFSVLAWRKLPRRFLVTGLLAVLVLAPFVATIWWERMLRTLSGDRGSFEVYTTFVRIYGWFAAGRMFVAHPLVGVGYLGFRHFSDRYNDLGLMLGTCENMYLEVATGMGLIGLIVFLRLIWRTMALGDVVAKHAPPDSWAAKMARLHKPYLLALAASNLTGDNWVGLVGIAQVAVWCALLVRAGQLSLDSRPPS